MGVRPLCDIHWARERARARTPPDASPLARRASVRPCVRGARWWCSAVVTRRHARVINSVRQAGKLDERAKTERGAAACVPRVARRDLGGPDPDRPVRRVLADISCSTTDRATCPVLSARGLWPGQVRSARQGRAGQGADDEDDENDARERRAGRRDARARARTEPEIARRSGRRRSTVDASGLCDALAAPPKALTVQDALARRCVRTARLEARGRATAGLGNAGMWERRAGRTGVGRARRLPKDHRRTVERAHKPRGAARCGAGAPGGCVHRRCIDARKRQ